MPMGMDQCSLVPLKREGSPCLGGGHNNSVPSSLEAAEMNSQTFFFKLFTIIYLRVGQHKAGEGNCNSRWPLLK